MDVDLDDAGVGRDADDVEARVVRRGVALDVDRAGPSPSPRPRRRRRARDSPRALSTGGMKTQSRPSRGSTERAVRTAPPTSPSSCSTRSCCSVSSAVKCAIGWARPPWIGCGGSAGAAAARSRKSGSGPRGTVGSTTWCRGSPTAGRRAACRAAGGSRPGCRRARGRESRGASFHFSERQRWPAACDCQRWTGRT